jgi:hypothetical protein
MNDTTGARSTREKLYEWPNSVFSGNVLNGKIGNLMGPVTAPVSGHSCPMGYFFCSAHKAGTSEEELAGVANIAAATPSIAVYAIIPKPEKETDV